MILIVVNIDHWKNWTFMKFVFKNHVVFFLRNKFSISKVHNNTSWREASDSETNSSMLSNPADAQNVSCLGLCGRNICPKSSA